MRFIYTLLILCLPILLKASHLTGYNVEYLTNSIGSTTIKYTLYRDCLGVVAGNTITVRIKGVNNNFCTQTLVLNKISENFISHRCDVIPTSCNDGPQVMQAVVYEANIVLPSCDTEFYLVNNHCSRTSAITNIRNAGSSCVVSTTRISRNISNKSPHYQTPTVMSYCAGVSYTYSQGIIESEGDSLSFELVVPPLDTNRVAVYNSGYSLYSPMLLEPGSSFNFDPNTGEISFTSRANIAQNILIAVRVNEYRGGVLIGSQSRELYFQFFVQCFNNPPIFENIEANSIAIQNTNQIVYCSNEDLHISFIIRGASFSRIIDIENNLTSLFPNAQFVTTGTNPINCDIFIPSSDFYNNSYSIDFISRYDECDQYTYNNLSLLLSKAPNNSIVFNAITPVCSYNDSVAISLQNTYTSYIWSTGQTTASIQSNISNNTYSVTVTDNNNCQYTDSISIPNITILPINFTVSKYDVICNTNGSINATSSTSNMTYALNNQVPQNNGLFENLVAGTYSIRLTNEHGCFVDTNIVINTTPLSSITPIAYDTLLCIGEQATLGLVENFATYAWSTGESTARINTVSNTNNYTVTVTDNNACIYTQNFNVVNTGLIEFTATLSHNLCNNDSIGQIRLMHDAAAFLYDYTISSGDSEITYGHFNNLASGNYTITATDTYGCTRVENYTINTLSIFELVDITNDTIIEEGSSVLLTSIINSNANIITENWTLPAHISNANYQTGSDVIIAPMQSDIYIFYAENEYGCRIDKSINIQVNPKIIIEDSTTYIVQFPNAFTPNGDGENDIFKPLGIPAQFVKEFKVYNRWGNLLFDGDLSIGGWDGNYKNELQARDIYIAFVKYILPNGEEKSAKVEFMLLR